MMDGGVEMLDQLMFYCLLAISMMCLLMSLTASCSHAFDSDPGDLDEHDPGDRDDNDPGDLDEYQDKDDEQQ